MFEKEAEEYSKKLLNPSLEYAFKDGAEFGYKKANEWHSTKNVACYEDFCLPLEAEWKDKRAIWKVQVIHKNGIREPICYHCGSFDDLWYDLNAHHVIAWKEIVPPKESE
jgi:hypothetical protein